MQVELLVERLPMIVRLSVAVPVDFEAWSVDVAPAGAVAPDHAVLGQVLRVSRPGLRFGGVEGLMAVFHGGEACLCDGVLQVVYDEVEALEDIDERVSELRAAVAELGQCTGLPARLEEAP